MVRANPEKIKALITEIFVRKNLKPEDAEIIADAMIDANLTGRASHGILRTTAYVDRLEAGGDNPRAEVKIVKESDTTALIDGDNGLGMPISYKAAKLTREKAEKHGMACVTVKNANHYGAAAYWTEMIAQDDMIAFSCTNVEPLVAPPGGKDVAMGTNPLCVYVPSATHGPMCLDIATSTVALGKLLDYRLKKEPLGVGWAVDANGIPTTDPEAATYLTPFGAHKGYGISVMIEVMTSLLAGGAIGHEINSMYGDMDKPNKISCCFIAIKIDRFRPLDEFKADVDRFIDFLHSVPAAEGQRVYFPGEIELINRKKAQEEGLLLPESLIEQLTAIAERLEIPNPSEYFA